jgi:hypothetical protein
VVAAKEAKNKGGAGKEGADGEEKEGELVDIEG